MLSRTKIWFWIFALELSFVPLAFLAWNRESFYVEQVENFTQAKFFLACLSLILVTLVYLSIFLKKEWRNEEISFKKLFIFLSPLFLLLVVSPPFLSVDTVAYLIPVKNYFIFGFNPYTVPFQQVVENSWVAQIGHPWRSDLITPYGPFFLLLLAPLAFLSTGLTTAIAIYKALLLIPYIFSVVIFDRLRAHFKTPPFVTVLFALNPLLLVFGLLEGHNDLILVALILAAVWFVLNKKFFHGNLALAAITAIKLFPIILAPIFWFEHGFFRWRKVFFSLLVILGFFFLTSLAFGFSTFPSLLKTIANQSSLSCLYICSPPQILFNVFSASLSTSLAFFLFSYSLIFWLFLFRSFKPVQFIFWSLMAFCFIYLRWLTPWYLMLPLPLALLLFESKKYRFWVVFLTVYAVWQTLWANVGFFGILLEKILSIL
jgi:hypothetical protein